MPNDNQPAKSYIAAVLARADGATGCAACEGEGEVWADGLAHSQSYRGPSMPCPSCGGVAVNHDTRTLATMLLRAIEALEYYAGCGGVPYQDDSHERAAEALAEINALAAKGSQ